MAYLSMIQCLVHCDWWVIAVLSAPRRVIAKPIQADLAPWFHSQNADAFKEKLRNGIIIALDQGYLLYSVMGKQLFSLSVI